jgi:hypothetical protein
MRNVSRTQTVLILSAQLAVVCAASPAAAISADLANKCRAMAIKAHPPPFPPGNKAYAVAERTFFSECVSKNGQMQNPEPPKDPNNPK